MSNVIELKTRKPREIDEAEEHAEYLALNKKQALNVVENLRRMINDDEVCAVLVLAATPPNRDGAGYRLMFNDAIEDYHLQTMGMLESSKVRLQSMQENWLDSEELPEDLPKDPDS